MLGILKKDSSQRAAKCFNEAVGRMAAVSAAAFVFLYIAKYENTHHPFFGIIYISKFVLAAFMIAMFLWGSYYAKNRLPFIYRYVVLRARMFGKSYFIVFYIGLILLIFLWFWLFMAEYSNFVTGFFDRNEGRPIVALMATEMLLFMFLLFLCCMCIAERRGINLSKRPTVRDEQQDSFV